MTISSVHNFKWDIKVEGDPLSADDVHFITNFAPQVFWNDLKCHNWCFDEHLPSGRWLENIFPNNELTEVKALVL